MTDREFLIWLHERLTEVHGESDLIGHCTGSAASFAQFQPTKQPPT